MNWISVKDRLPEDRKHVLLWLTGFWKGEPHQYFERGFFMADEIYVINGKRSDEDKITHWCEVTPPDTKELQTSKIMRPYPVMLNITVSLQDNLLKAGEFNNFVNDLFNIERKSKMSTEELISDDTETEIERMHYNDELAKFDWVIYKGVRYE